MNHQSKINESQTKELYLNNKPYPLNINFSKSKLGASSYPVQFLNYQKTIKLNKDAKKSYYVAKLKSSKSIESLNKKVGLQ